MKFYTISQVANKLNLSTTWINRLIIRGTLKGKRYGNTWLITEKQLNQYLKNRQKKETDKKKEYRQWLKEHDFEYNRQKGKSRGYWKDNVYYGVTATEAYEKYQKDKSS